jgi:hypothetical protein
MSSIERWQQLLSQGPFISSETEHFHEYVQYINALESSAKADDFGAVATVMAEIDEFQCDANNIDIVTGLHTEANERAVAHVIYLHHAHNLGFYEGVDTSPAGLGVILKEGAIKAYTEAESLNDLGIKMVEFTAENILD